MSDFDREHLAVANVTNCLEQVDDRLLEPEILEVTLFARTVLSAHF